ncbi:hypothetical protein K8R43_00645 [archaeon]|nr:hypothetical protein [archaeon]
MKGLIIAAIIVLVLVIIGLSGFFVFTLLFNESQGGSSVEVVVYDELSLMSVDEGTVTVYDLDQNQLDVITADSRGVAYLDLVPGEYLLAISAPGYQEKWASLNVSETSDLVDVPLERISTCVEEWECGSWSPCVEGFQSRTCEDVTECGTEYDKPSEQQECSLQACSSDLDCDDGDSCTEDVCSGGTMCTNSRITQCKSGDNCCPSGCNSIIDSDCGSSPSSGCQSDSECDDANPCTSDECENEVCYFNDKSDDSSCGTDKICCDGSCGYIVCSSDSDCDDSDSGTDDDCVYPGKCNAYCTNTGSGGCTNECSPEGMFCDGTTWINCSYCDTDECLDECSPQYNCAEQNSSSGNCWCECGDYTLGNEDDVDGGCSDSLDNDCDGDTNCDDSDCASDPYCAGGCSNNGESCLLDGDCCDPSLCDDSESTCYECNGFLDHAGLCELECGAPACDDELPGSSSGGTCCVSDCSASTSVGSCDCLTGNCESGYCSSGSACYSGVTCSSPGWDYSDLNSSCEDVCSASLLGFRACDVSGCFQHHTYVCDVSNECSSGSSDMHCGSNTYNCHYSNAGTYEWYVGPMPYGTETACEDGYDNDCDGLIDCEGAGDPDCHCSTQTCNEVCLSISGCVNGGFCTNIASPYVDCVFSGCIVKYNRCEENGDGRDYCVGQGLARCICEGILLPP